MSQNWKVPLELDNAAGAGGVLQEVSNALETLDTNWAGGSPPAGATGPTDGRTWADLGGTPPRKQLTI